MILQDALNTLARLCHGFQSAGCILQIQTIAFEILQRMTLVGFDFWNVESSKMDSLYIYSGIQLQSDIVRDCYKSFPSRSLI